MATGAVSVTVNRAGVDRLTRDPNGPVGAHLTRLLNQIANAARARANVDTGLMRSRIEFRILPGSGPLQGEVAARTNYSLYVHNGTRYYPGNPFLTDAARDVLGR